MAKAILFLYWWNNKSTERFRARQWNYLKNLIWAQHSWQRRRSVYHWGRARTPAAEYIWAFWPLATLSNPTRRVFHHLSLQSALTWTSPLRLCYVHPDVILDSWVQQVNMRANKWRKKIWFFWISPAVYVVKMPEAYERRDSLSPFVVFIYTPKLDVIHQITECIRRNYLTGRQTYLYQLLHSSASTHSLSSRRQ